MFEPYIITSSLWLPLNLGKKNQVVCNQAYKPDRWVVKAMLNEQEAPKLFCNKACKPNQEGSHSYAQ